MNTINMEFHDCVLYKIHVSDDTTTLRLISPNLLDGIEGIIFKNSQIISNQFDGVKQNIFAKCIDGSVEKDSYILNFKQNDINYQIVLKTENMTLIRRNVVVENEIYSAFKHNKNAMYYLKMLRYIRIVEQLAVDEYADKKIIKEYLFNGIKLFVGLMITANRSNKSLNIYGFTDVDVQKYLDINDFFKKDIYELYVSIKNIDIQSGNIYRVFTEKTKAINDKLPCLYGLCFR